MTQTDACGCTYDLVTGAPRALCANHTLPELETDCADCLASGSVQTDEGERPCPECEGVGSIPTGAGRAVLSFVTRHGEEL